MEHRYEIKACAEMQAGGIQPLGRRNLTQAWQAEMDARNNETIRRRLAGRRSAAALEWLMKRQQERVQGEQLQETYRPLRRGAGVLGHGQTSPNNPLCYKQPEQPKPVPTPTEMAAALAAMDLSQTDAVTAAAAATSAADVTCSSGCCGGADAAGVTGDTSLQADADVDAVAVIAEPVEAAAAAGGGTVPAHMKGHMETGSLTPVQEPTPVPTPYQAATQAAFWRQQEMDELLYALLEQYPHGIPKKMLLDLRQLGIYDAPGLGFGCPSSSLAMSTLLLKPMV